MRQVRFESWIDRVKGQAEIGNQKEFRSMRSPSFNMLTNIARNSASLSTEHPKSIQKKDICASNIPLQMPHRYFILHKPYNMVSQFKSPDKVRLLSDLDYPFPEGTHAIGRLDGHSEGLLLLTTDKRVTRLLFEGPVPHKRTYLLQVKNVMTAATLGQLRQGVNIRVGVDTWYRSVPVAVELSEMPPDLPPIQEHYRPDIPHTWLRITLTEGKFHQVRKMVAAVGHRCKRLIRISIEDMQLGNLKAGEVLEMDQASFFKLLHIPDPDYQT